MGPEPDWPREKKRVKDSFSVRYSVPSYAGIFQHKVFSQEGQYTIFSQCGIQKYRIQNAREGGM
jgi:hypothetical protein